jgi:hypothetical protein
MHSFSDMHTQVVDLLVSFAFSACMGDGRIKWSITTFS